MDKKKSPSQGGYSLDEILAEARSLKRQQEVPLPHADDDTMETLLRFDTEDILLSRSPELPEEDKRQYLFPEDFAPEEVGDELSKPSRAERRAQRQERKAHPAAPAPRESDAPRQRAPEPPPPPEPEPPPPRPPEPMTEPTPAPTEPAPRPALEPAYAPVPLHMGDTNEQIALYPAEPPQGATGSVKKKRRQRGRNLFKDNDTASTEDDIYYGLQLKPLEEYSKDYEHVMHFDKPDTPEAAAEEQSGEEAAGKSNYGYLFHTDEETDTDLSSKFEELHKARKSRLAKLSGQEDIFSLGRRTTGTDLRLPPKERPGAQPAAEEKFPTQVAPSHSQRSAAEDEIGEEAPKQHFEPETVPLPLPVVTPPAPAAPVLPPIPMPLPAPAEPGQSRRRTPSAPIFMPDNTAEIPIAAPPAPEAAAAAEREEEPAPVREPVPAPPAPRTELPVPPPMREPPENSRPPMQAEATEATEPVKADEEIKDAEPVKAADASGPPLAYRTTRLPTWIMDLGDLLLPLENEAKGYPRPAPKAGWVSPVAAATAPPVQRAGGEDIDDIGGDFPVVLPFPGAQINAHLSLGNEPPEPAPEEAPVDEHRRKPRSFHLMGHDEAENSPEEELPEEQEELDDYRAPADAPSILHELNANRRMLYLRLAVTGIATFATLIFGLLGEKTGLFPGLSPALIPTQTYLIVSLVFLLIAVAFCAVTLLSGVKALFTAQANADSGVAIAAVAAVAQTVVLLLSSAKAESGLLHLYAVPVCAALFLNTAGKLSLVKRVAHSFRFVSSPEQKYAVQLFEDHNTSLQMANNCVLETPQLAYQGKTGFLKHFLRLSYEADPSDQKSQLIAPIGVVCSLVLFIATLILSDDAVAALTAFTAGCCVCVPFMNMLSVNLPLSRVSKLAARCGGMVVGWPAVERFSAVNALVLDAEDLFPKGTVVLNGIKTFGEQRIDEAILDATALMCSVGGPLSDLFDQIIQSHQNILPKAENTSFMDGQGVIGWVNSRRVLVGNRVLLETHSVAPPSRDYEAKYLAGGKEVVYLAVGGDLVAMFIVCYNSDRRRALELRRMENNGVSLIVRTCDPNITPAFLANCFGLDENSINVLPERLGKEYGTLVDEPTERAAALLATKGRPTAMMRLITACIRQRSSISIAVLLQTLGVVLGFVMVAFLSCYSSLHQLSVPAFLLYELFWALAVYFLPKLRRP